MENFNTLIKKYQEARGQEKDRYIRLESLFANTSIGIVKVGLSGELLEMNDAFCRITRRDRETLTGLRWRDITREDFLEEAKDRSQKISRRVKLLFLALGAVAFVVVYVLYELNLLQGFVGYLLGR